MFKNKKAITITTIVLVMVLALFIIPYIFMSKFMGNCWRDKAEKEQAKLSSFVTEANILPNQKVEYSQSLSGDCLDTGSIDVNVSAAYTLSSNVKYSEAEGTVRSTLGSNKLSFTKSKSNFDVKSDGAYLYNVVTVPQLKNDTFIMYFNVAKDENCEKILREDKYNLSDYSTCYSDMYKKFGDNITIDSVLFTANRSFK